MSDFRLVYYSQNRIATERLSGEIETILEASRRNNSLVGVTGALIFSAGHFAQVLEGAQAAIESTFERIQQDTRHGDVQLLDFSPAPERRFDNWSMAFVGPADGDYARIAETRHSDLRSLSGHEILDRLREMLVQDRHP